MNLVSFVFLHFDGKWQYRMNGITVIMLFGMYFGIHSGIKKLQGRDDAYITPIIYIYVLLESCQSQGPKMGHSG